MVEKGYLQPDLGDQVSLWENFPVKKKKIYVNYVNYMILIYNILFTIVRKIISHTKFC